MINHLSSANLSAGILSSIGSIALAILVLLFMITVHEFGHYIIAKLFNFKITEFAIGMGPALYKKVKKNSEIFSIRLLPLGGFCAFEGEDEENGDPRAFNNKKPWQRILVLIAGATMNFIAAVIIFCISIGAYGQMCLQAFEVVPTQPSSAYSLQSEDVLLSLNGKDLYLTTDIINAINGKKQGDLVDATVLRDGKKQDIQIKLLADATSKSIEDSANIFKSLGIATLTAVTESENKRADTLLSGDSILRISKVKPELKTQAEIASAPELFTECCVIGGENGLETILCYIDNAQYLSETRAFSPQDFASLVREFSNGETLYLYISRGENRVLLEFELNEEFDKIKATDEGIFNYFNVTMQEVGFRISSENVRFGFFESIARGFVYACKNVSSTLSAFWQLLTGRLSLNALGGPVTTITITSQYASLGFNYLLEIAGAIGVSLAVFNLLPIPALDGARVIFVLIEWIRKKPINRNVEGTIHAIGLILLLIFAVSIDLIKCF